MSLVNIIGRRARRTDKNVKPYLGKKIVFIGDSITVRFGPGSNKWATYYSNAKGNVEINMGISGQVMQDGVDPGVSNYPLIQAFDQNTIPSKQPDDVRIFFALGTNDIGINNGVMSPSGYQSTYIDALEYAVDNQGWSYSDIVLLTTYPMRSDGYGYAQYLSSAYGVTTAGNVTRHEQYVQKVKDIATLKGTKIADVYQFLKDMGSSRDALMESDGLHWNDDGHAVIAGFLIGQSI